MPGNYSVSELVPGDWNLTSLIVTDPTNDSTTNLSTANLVLAPGETIYVTYSDSKVTTGDISGTKWLDVTGNGLSPDDTAMSGVKIYLDTNNDGSWESNEPSQFTAADGTYSFTGLAAGTYVVREVTPSGYVRTAPTLSDHYTINLAAGTDSVGNDFANAESCDCFSLCNVFYTINDCTTVSDLRGHTNEGDVVEVTFTVPNGQAPHPFTLVSYTAPGPTFVAADAYEQQIFDIDTGVFGPGTYTLMVTIPHSFYQVDFVCGNAIDMFGPEGSNIFYSPQHRLFQRRQRRHAPRADRRRLAVGLRLRRRQQRRRSAGDRVRRVRQRRQAHGHGHQWPLRQPVGRDRQQRHVPVRQPGPGHLYGHRDRRGHVHPESQRDRHTRRRSNRPTSSPASSSAAATPAPITTSVSSRPRPAPLPPIKRPRSPSGPATRVRI